MKKILFIIALMASFDVNAGQLSQYTQINGEKIARPVQKPVGTSNKLIFPKGTNLEKGDEIYCEEIGSGYAFCRKVDK